MAVCALLLSQATGCAANPPPEPTDPRGTADNSEAVPARSSGWDPGRPGFAARRATAQAEIGEATRTLETAGDACGDACPAMVELRRGVHNLCSVKDTRDDENVCKDYRTQLVAAEGHLRASCGACKPPSPDADEGADPAP